MSVNEKMKAIADAIRDKTKGTEALTLNDMATEIPKVYEEGYNKATEENPAYYMWVKGFQWQGQTFPEGFNFVLRLRNKPDDMNAAIMRTTGIKAITLICEAEGACSFAQLIRESTVEVLDLTKFKPKPNAFSYFAYGANKLVSIYGALDLSQCTTATLSFGTARSLKDIEFVENSINMSIDFQYSTNLTTASLTSIINGLNADVTGQTLTLSKTAVNNAFGIDIDDVWTWTDEWNILRDSKSNWTFSYA